MGQRVGAQIAQPFPGRNVALFRVAVEAVDVCRLCARDGLVELSVRPVGVVRHLRQSPRVLWKLEGETIVRRQQ